MNTEELYVHHLNDLQFSNIDSCANEDVKSMLDRLILCLPNNGKLYKYRAISGQAFEYAFDSLKNGYFWMAKASTTNDDFDCTLNYDLDADIKSAKDEFLKRPWKYLETLMRENLDKFGSMLPLDVFYVKQVLNCLNDEDQLEEEKALKLLVSKGFTRHQAKEFLNDVYVRIERRIDEISHALKDAVDGILGINKKNRDSIFVCSMATRYDADNMWAYYADNNRGFCIEYDFKKGRGLSPAQIRKICRCYRVKYQEQKELFSFRKTFEYLCKGKTDQELFKSIISEFVNQISIKTGGWDKEVEWRLMMFQLKDSRLFADIVSGIIIDERVIYTDNAVRLIQLAKERGWSIKVRKMNVIGTQHLYEDYVA